jgi:hypothetical protein
MVPLSANQIISMDSGFVKALTQPPFCGGCAAAPLKSFLKGSRIFCWFSFANVDKVMDVPVPFLAKCL